MESDRRRRGRRSGASPVRVLTRGKGADVREPWGTPGSGGGRRS